MMAVTVKVLKDTLEEMRKIYPFEDTDTLIEIRQNPLKQHIGTVVEITTVDKKTATEVRLSKDVEKEMIK